MPTPARRRFGPIWSPRLARFVAVACVVATAGVPAAAGPATAAPVPPSPAAPAAAQGPTHTVTLLTGDRVEYTEQSTGQPRVVVDPADRPDAAPVTFTTAALTGPGGRPALYVVPSDADPSLAAGTLDRELFNVRELTRQGLDDSAARELPLIATYDTAPATTALPGSRLTRKLPAVRGQALRVDRTRGAEFWRTVGPPRPTGGRAPAALQRGVRKLWLDRRVTAALDQSVPQIGAPTAWQAGFDGTGVTVAVLDTGADPDHPDLAGKIVGSSDFTDSGTTADGHGHGTHCASIIVGSGAASDGRYRGVAPGAKLMVGKVLADDGTGLDSWVMDGMDWAAHSGARVISMSLGGEPTDGTDPLSQQIDALTAETGALFVVAAGNSGGSVTVGSPGTASTALTVGAVDKQNRLADFSSRGPRLGDGAAKPEIVAPGVNIVAARAAGTSLGTPVSDRYTALSGTSMATPHVAGAAAILAQEHPSWHAEQLKDGLVSSSADVGVTWSAQGTGRVDVARAVRTDVTGSAVVNLGRMAAASGTARNPVRYANGGTAPVTLNLRLALTGWNRQPAPTALGTLSAGTVTVPAGGSASVDLVVNPAAGAGEYGGTVLATTADGAVAVRTLVSAYIAPPTANVTVRITDQRGKPAPFASVTLVDAGNDPATGNDPFTAPLTGVFVANGTGTAEVRRGAVLTAMASLTSFAVDGRRTDMLVSPEVTVNGDTVIDLDARKGQQHRVGTGDPTDELAKATEVVRTTAGAIASMVAFTRADPDTVTYVTPVPKASLGDLDTYDKRTLADAGLRMSAKPPSGTAAVTLHPRYDPYATPAKLPGDRTLAVTWIGQGTSADIAGADLTGRLALAGIRIPDGTANPLGYASQAANAANQAAAKAGAVATAVFVDAPGAVALPRPGSAPVPQLFLTRDEGTQLRGWVGAGPLSVTLTGNPSPRTNTNLLYTARGVPAGGTDTAVPAQLASIPTRYHADKSMTYEKNWYAFGTRSLVAFRERVLFTAPAARVEYVGPADATVRWTRWTTQNDQAPNRPPLIASLISQDTYATGGRLLPEERWYEGPILEGEPGTNPTAACGLCRGGPDGNLLIPAWHLGDSTDGHAVQSWPDYRSDVHLFRGSTEIPAQPLSNSLPMPTFRLPSTVDTYRMVVDGPTPWNPSVRPVQHTTTEWTFRSAPPQAPGATCPGVLGGTCTHQPLIQVKYRLGLDLTNRVQVGAPLTFTVSAQLPAGASGGPVTGLWLWSSSDAGASWRPARVQSVSPGQFQVTVVNPPAGGDGSVWLRTEAWDGAGDRVRQTVQGAYFLAVPAAGR
jgi:subtilisin family serine protease